MKKHLKTKLRKIGKPIDIIIFLASCGSGGGRDNNDGVVSKFAPSVSVANDFSVNELEQVNQSEVPAFEVRVTDNDGATASSSIDGNIYYSNREPSTRFDLNDIDIGYQEWIAETA